MVPVFTRRAFCVFSALLMLAACTATAPKKPPVVTAAGTQGYLLNLSLAHLSLDRNPENVNAALPAITRMNGYALKGVPKQTTATVVVMKFKTRDDQRSYTVMVPVVAPHGRAAEFGGLQQMVHQINAAGAEYRTIHVRTVTLTTREPVSTKASPSDITSKINDLYQTVFESAAVPPRLETARLQIALTRFFMRENVRDAAYVSLENAKELLAGVDTSSQADANEVQALSKELESLEDTLHKKLPYTF